MSKLGKEIIESLKEGLALIKAGRVPKLSNGPVGDGNCNVPAESPSDAPLDDRWLWEKAKDYLALDGVPDDAISMDVKLKIDSLIGFVHWLDIRLGINVKGNLGVTLMAEPETVDGRFYYALLDEQHEQAKRIAELEAENARLRGEK